MLVLLAGCRGDPIARPCAGCRVTSRPRRSRLGRCSGRSSRRPPARTVDDHARSEREALREGKYPWYDSETDRVAAGLAGSACRGWSGWASVCEAFFRRIGRFFRRLRFGATAGSRYPRGFDRHDRCCWRRSWRFSCSWSCSGFAASAERLRGRVRAGRGWEPPRGWATFPRGSGRRTAIPGPRQAAAGGGRPGRRGRLPVRAPIARLDQLGLIRLAPGRTGRHYVQSLRDRELDRLPGRDPCGCSRMSTTGGGRRPPRRSSRSGIGPWRSRSASG